MRYGSKDIDVPQERQALEVKVCPLEIQMPSELKGDLEGQRQWFKTELPRIYKAQKGPKGSVSRRCRPRFRGVRAVFGRF